MKRLADKIRPELLSDIIGQAKLLKKNGLIDKMVEHKKPLSLLFYGRPGIGKTSMAIVLSNELKLSYAIFNCANDNKSKLIEILKNQQVKVIIVEEIHRLNKDKQEILLPHLEKNKIIMFASTTENPFFRVLPAIRSRIFILELDEITHQDIYKGLKHVIKRHNLNIKINNPALEFISRAASGDFRQALNILETIDLFYPGERVTLHEVKKLAPSLNFYSDRAGDNNYDLLSAFHKSMRGSDVDASLYYLACLIKSGDLIGIRRRMLTIVYEDISLASPNVAVRVKTACDVCEELGFPEAKHILASAVTDICLAPKSNATYHAINKIIDKIDKEGIKMMPNHLRDAHYKSAKKLNRGQNYLYPHNYDGAFIEQRYLPEEIDEIFYQPKANGIEQLIYSNRPKKTNK